MKTETRYQQPEGAKEERKAPVPQKLQQLQTTLLLLWHQNSP